MKSRIALVLTILLLGLALSVSAEQTDTKGCKDHPLFTRMPGSWIHHCAEKEFDSHAFVTGPNKQTTEVEGRLWSAGYYPQSNATVRPSELQILRNFENAVQRLGGTKLWGDKSHDTFRVSRGGKEFWVDLWAEFTGKYGFVIVEKGEMKQDIEANAGVFANDLRQTGHVALYGILFDTAKAVIKPESAQAIGEVAKLLKNEPALKLYVVGHTDNVGGVDSNLKLSDARAQAVMQALVRDHGIAATRLRAFGAAQFAPVASNDTEEGRAKNRRVELVKQ